MHSSTHLHEGNSLISGADLGRTVICLVNTSPHEPNVNRSHDGAGFSSHFAPVQSVLQMHSCPSLEDGYPCTHRSLSGLSTGYSFTTATSSFISRGGGEGRGGEGEGEGEGGTEGEGSDGDAGEGHSSKSAEGVRDDSDGERQHSATKVWELRSFEEYDPDVELGTRNIKMALRRLRKFARTSSLLELDLPATIRSTAKQAGLLDIVEVPERHNSVKVLLLLDVGGSMDEFAILCEQLFSAASSEFKYMEIFYFHNIFYESLWTSSTRSPESRIKTIDVLRKYGSDYKIIIVGDGNMARHEIAEKGGSVERYNPESGELWLQRFQESFRKIVWLNPTEESRWLDVYTIQMLRRLMPGQMFHLSVSGIEQAMKKLTR